MSQLVSPRAFLGETLQPAKWRDRAHADLFYAFSSLTPVFMGWGMHLCEKRLSFTCPLFPWSAMKFTLLAQGILSYQGDVATFGESSWWKAADVWLATFHTAIYLLFAGFPFMGIATWPWTVCASQLAAGLVALHCKRMGVRALRQDAEDAFFWYHAMWHYVIFAGAATSLFLIYNFIFFITIDLINM